ncbi:23S rRNA (pseudouridine(1915)-N(3))-methyltransferase RlmH [Oscillospiraceae bacterium WX1]
MLHIRLICVGKLKEKFYIDAVGEYEKRLSAYCRLETAVLSEVRLPDRPSEADVEAALRAEADGILSKLWKGAAVVALCIEGAEQDSGDVARLLDKYASSGVSRLCFVIGGSNGLHASVKALADIKLSMSRMTFPHHLARVMLLEQLYRGFKILEGGAYHK